MSWGIQTGASFDWETVIYQRCILCDGVLRGMARAAMAAVRVTDLRPSTEFCANWTALPRISTLSADVERTKVTVVVNDKSTENGSMLVRGDKMLLEMKAPNARTILRTGDNLFVYTPGLNRVEEYNLAQHRAWSISICC